MSAVTTIQCQYVFRRNGSKHKKGSKCAAKLRGEEYKKTGLCCKHFKYAKYQEDKECEDLALEIIEDAEFPQKLCRIPWRTPKKEAVKIVPVEFSFDLTISDSDSQVGVGSPSLDLALEEEPFTPSPKTDEYVPSPPLFTPETPLDCEEIRFSLAESDDGSQVIVSLSFEQERCSSSPEF